MSVDLHGIGMTSQRARERLIGTLKDMGVTTASILDAIRETPRHLFVDEALASRAYENAALPIGHCQTISQPYIVARMTEAVLNESPLRRVLEVGTGCGYQSVILARFAEQVYTVDRIATMIKRARERFYTLKCNNIRALHADGTLGWERYAPYDAIVVSAAPERVPQPLLAQLAVYGRLVIPVGVPGRQRLMRILRTGKGYHEECLNDVSFVSMHSGLCD